MNHVAFLPAVAILLFMICFWALMVRDLLLTWLKVPSLVPEDEAPLPKAVPLISVIVPAHNEEAFISECLESVLAQDYPRLELICVDDRSADRTATIVGELFRNRIGCKFVSVSGLPDGWTGKCHALSEGVRHARGDWLAFLDADSRLERSALRQCYGEAVRKQVGMVTLSPQFIVKTFWEKALLPAFASVSCMLFPLSEVNDPSSPVASANGMFYLISRKTYDGIGGHHDVKDLAVEDIGIGKRAKAAGFGLVFANGRKILQTRMYTNFRETFNGWSRIISASMNYRLTTVFKHFATHLLMSVPVLAAALCFYIPAAREIWPGAWFILPCLCAASMAVVPCFYYRQLGVPPKYSAFLGIGNLVLVAAFAVMIKQILCRDALQWRGTTYTTNRYEPRRLDPVPSSPTRVVRPSPSTVLEEVK